MTVLSWSLEFLSGLLIIFLSYLSHNQHNVDLIVLVVIIDIFIIFILIPSTYIFNNEVNKTLINAEGWCNSFRACFQSNRVDPTANNNNGPNENQN